MVLFYISDNITTKGLHRIELNSIHELVTKIVESAKTTKVHKPVGEIITHIRRFLEVRNVYKIFIMYIIPTIAIGIGILYNFYQGDGKYSILVFIILMIMIAITTKLEIDNINCDKIAEDSLLDTYGEMVNIFDNIDILLTSDIKQHRLESFTKSKTKTFKLKTISKFNDNNIKYGLYMFNLLIVFIISYLAYNLYIQEKINAALFTAIILLVLVFMDYYKDCITLISDLITNVGRYTKTKDYFNELKIINRKKDLLNNLCISRGDIKINNLTVIRGEKNIFNNINLFIKGNSVTGLVGSIGSGKSTLLKILAGIAQYEGKILIDGYNIEECTYESLVNSITYIPQGSRLINKTIYYNLNYGSNYTKNEIIKKLEYYDLMPFINTFSDKLDTDVGKNDETKLSGGQKQFISFIRTLIQDKPILLLDEPTASLDDSTRIKFIEIINKIKKDKTIIISSHDNLLTDLFDQTVEFDNL
jgi:ABC-type multidrug transport system fused ATPase/permease subunit